MANRVLGGRYAVQDKIGTGGMAIVYRGLDEVLGRTVAIKTMLPQYANDQSFAARFKQEAQAAAALQSPYIVSVYDWGKDENTYYIIMEYLRGTDLKSGIRKHGALDCRKVAQIGSQIAQALSSAHHHDIIHRDIKPQNIMVQPDGNIKVMDFGIARAKNSHLTADNSVLGTAHYVSPEQTQGRELGPTTDIYSLGIVMYEASTGQVPFDGDDAITVALKQVNESPLPPSQINPNVDPTLESIILRCMQKNPNDRYQSADELYRVLREYLSGRVQNVRDVTQTTDTPKNTRRATDEPWNGHSPQQYQHSNVTTTGHYHSNKSATQEEIDRRHRRNVLIGVLFSLVVIAVIGIIVFILSSRPQTRTVPNLIGLTEESATEQIEQSEHFKIGTIKEEFSSKVDAGKVIDQDPDAGNSLPKDTYINLVISKGEEPAASVTVPNLIGKPVSEAEDELRRLNLIGQAGDPIYSETIDVGLIAVQNPASGATVKAGDTITYQTSLGKESGAIPEVVGYSQENATQMIEAAGFKVIVSTTESDDYSAGIVCAQATVGTAQKGSEVYITVSTGPHKIEVPVVIGMGENDALAALEGAAIAVNVAEVPSDIVEAGYVVDQSASGSVDHNTVVTITVSTGPVPVEVPETPVTPDPGVEQHEETVEGESGYEEGTYY